MIFMKCCSPVSICMFVYYKFSCKRSGFAELNIEFSLESGAEICPPSPGGLGTVWQGRGQSPDHRAGCQDCPGLDGCQHQARGHPRVQGGAQYRAAEERGDKSSRGDPATSGLCLFSLGLHLFYEQHSRQDVKLQPNVTKSQEHRLHLKFDHLHHLDKD